VTRSRILLSTAVAISLVAALTMLQRNPGESPGPGTLQVASLLGDAGATGLRKADPSYTLAFPGDHGAHPDYRSEWWYFTGNLDAADGRRFGFQFTIFRFALGAAGSDRESRWSTRQAWMGHLAVTDVDASRFFRAERLARGGDMGLAGARAAPFHAWIDGWQMRSLQSAFLPLDLSAQAEDFGLDLRLSPGRGPILQGDRGFSRKGPGPGNASYYYSYTRLPVSGALRVSGETVPVTGNAWLDREWGTSALGPDVRGWDWFALQFDDGSELMYYRLRHEDGSADPLSSGILAAGSVRHLDAAGVTLTPGRYWKSPETGARYPVSWELSIPSENVDLQVDALVDDQEMDLSVTYWEGAVRVRGTRGGTSITGRGYLEMTGYETSTLSP